MKKQDAIDHYGSIRKLAHAIDVSTQAIYSWGEDVPESWAYKIQVLTDDVLRVNDEHEMRA